MSDASCWLVFNVEQTSDLAVGIRAALANGQKTTLSQTGIGQSQGAETFAVEFLVYVETIFPIGIDVRVACWPEMRYIGARSPPPMDNVGASSLTSKTLKKRCSNASRRISRSGLTHEPNERHSRIRMSDAKLDATGRDFCQIWCD